MKTTMLTILSILTTLMLVSSISAVNAYQFNKTSVECDENDSCIEIYLKMKIDETLVKQLQNMSAQQALNQYGGNLN